MKKSFAEVLEIKNGRNQKSVESPNGRYPIYGSGGIMGRADAFICNAGTVIIGRKGTINNPIFVNEPFWNVDTAFGLEANRDILYPKYLFYFCKSFNFESLNTTVTIPSLTKNNLLKIKMPIVSLDEQKKIATQLDTIQSAIDNKKQQLTLLDEVVKSEFVEMFGNPIHNTKGFPTKKVIDVVTMQRGYDLPVQDRETTGNIPVFGSNGILGNHNVAKIDKGIVTGRSGTIGEVYMCEEPFWPLNTTLFSNDTHGNNICYLKFLLEFFDLKRFKSGVGVPTLNRNEFHDEQIIDVSLELQNKFATFVQQIDKSKVVVKKQIADLQELLDSKMQEYFGE